MAMDPPGGRTDRPALRRCVAVDPAEFASAHWGRGPLLTRGAEGFTDLLDPDDVDELLSRRGLRTPFLRMASDGRVLPAASFAGGGGAGAEIADQVLDERVLALCADGATLVLQGLHRIWPPLIDFAGRLAADIGAPVQVNAYLTPPGGQGFATHYDTHDVFVLQVAGRKHWRIHPPVLPDPLERQPWGGRADEVVASAAAPAVLDTVLAPGDALYLPRGWLHSAQATDERSLHLTCGVRAPTRYTLVEALLALAVSEPELRTGFALGTDLTDPEQLGPELTASIGALRDWLPRAEPAEVARVLRERLWPTTRPAPIRPLAQLDAAGAVDGDTVLAARPGLRWRLAADGAERVVLELTGRALSMPAFCAPALRALLDADRIKVAELPGLDADDQIVLARRLLREAVAVPA